MAPNDRKMIDTVVYYWTHYWLKMSISVNNKVGSDDYKWKLLFAYSNIK